MEVLTHLRFCYLHMHCCKHVLDEVYMKALDLMSVDNIAATENEVQ